MKRPDIQAKRALFLASDRAPFKQSRNRHDGKPTIPQKILLGHLEGATLEFRLSRAKGSLSVDIAVPFLKLAIEVDGRSHRQEKQKKRDVRKEQILKERGWTLLRFQNAEILGNLSSVLERIEATVAMLQKVG